MEVDNYTFNVHNKEEFPPAHTAEHLLNQLMVRMFGTDRTKEKQNDFRASTKTIAKRRKSHNR